MILTHSFFWPNWKDDREKMSKNRRKKRENNNLKKCLIQTRLYF